MENSNNCNSILGKSIKYMQELSKNRVRNNNNSNNSNSNGGNNNGSQDVGVKGLF
jgi:hypothetical protein